MPFLTLSIMEEGLEPNILYKSFIATFVSDIISYSQCEPEDAFQIFEKLYQTKLLKQQ